MMTYEYCTGEPVQTYKVPHTGCAVELHRDAFGMCTVVVRSGLNTDPDVVLAHTKDFGAAAAVYAEAEKQLQRLYKFLSASQVGCIRSVIGNFDSPANRSMRQPEPAYFVEENVDEMLAGCDDVVAACSEEYLS